MRQTKLGLMIPLFCVLFAWSSLHAQEHGGGAAPAEKGDKGGAKESGLPPWFANEAKISELSARIRTTEEELRKLIAEKKELPENSPAVKPLVKNILKSHKELGKLIDEFQKNMNILKYRFPERGQKAERTYEKMELKSVDELEQAVGIDGKLSRNVNRMRSAYGTQAPTSQKDKANIQDDKKTAPQKSIEEEAPINLTK